MQRAGAGLCISQSGARSETSMSDGIYGEWNLVICPTISCCCSQLLVSMLVSCELDPGDLIMGLERTKRWSSPSTPCLPSSPYLGTISWHQSTGWHRTNSSPAVLSYGSRNLLEPGRQTRDIHSLTVESALFRYWRVSNWLLDWWIG